MPADLQSVNEPKSVYDAAYEKLRLAQECVQDASDMIKLAVDERKAMAAAKSDMLDTDIISIPKPSELQAELLCNMRQKVLTLTNKIEKLSSKIIQLERGVVYQEDKVQEPLLDPANSECLFIKEEGMMKYGDLWHQYLKARAAFWTELDINLTSDERDWETKLNDKERMLIKRVLAFFACSDNIVIENLSKEMSKVTHIEARAFYICQELIELIHATSYSKILYALVKDPAELDALLNAFKNNSFPCIRKKIEWAQKWTSAGSPFSYNVLAYICVELIFFASSFAVFDWFKSRGYLSGCCTLNDYISRDERGHGAYGIYVFRKYVANKPSHSVIKQMLMEACAIEKEFFSEILPEPINGMNDVLMHSHISFIVNCLFTELGIEYKPFPETQSPFPFSKLSSLSTKVDFFNNTVTDYQLARFDKPDISISALFASADNAVRTCDTDCVPAVKKPPPKRRRAVDDDDTFVATRRR